MGTIHKGFAFGVVAALLSYQSHSQVVTLERQVVASSGNHVDFANGMNFTYTVGEMAIATKGSNQYVLTEGFNQPDGELLPALNIQVVQTESQCPGMKDGVIEVNPGGCLPPYSIQFIGKGDTTLLTNINGPYSFTGLDSGDYMVTVRGMTLCTEVNNIRLELKNNTCDVQYYSGITPNGDGSNDTWIIDNIEINQPNEVRIFNRWGNLVWNKSNYNNTTVAWRGENNNGNPLPNGTYFYAIEIQGNSSAGKSGWIQITR